MCALAARIFDPTVHGGLVFAGYVSVIIEGQSAARVGDMHNCPAINPGTNTPHVGGPILPLGAPSVLIGGQPAARVGDWCTCAGAIDVILKGAIRTNIGPPAPDLPPAPLLYSVGGDPSGLVANWAAFVNWLAWVNAVVEWSAGALVAVVVGALWWVAVCKVRDLRFRLPPGTPSLSSFDPNALTVLDEGVGDNAPVYFL